MSNKTHQLERICPKTGFKETITYTGSLTNKPKGWKKIRSESHD